MTSGDDLTLTQRVQLDDGEIAYTVIGDGPPLVLVHGTPTSSYLWRNVAPSLAATCRVHLFDMLGFGESERFEEQDVPIRRHARVLADLISHWGLQDPVLVGHDIGGATVLRAHLLENAPAAGLVLIDAVVLRPWITPTTQHIRAHIDTYRSMPNHIWSEVASAHLRRAVHGEMSAATFHGYWQQWEGPRGQALWLRNALHFDEQDTADFEDRLGEIDVPTSILWGENDDWLDVSISAEIQRRIPGSQLVLISGAGHFAMEDKPHEVATHIKKAVHARSQ